MKELNKVFRKKNIGILGKHSDFPVLGSENGYLLIELLIAMTLFSVIVVIAIGSFVNVLKTQRQVEALAAAESNLNVAFEQMTREIRTGYSFCDTASCGCSPLASLGSGVNQVNQIECASLNFIDAQTTQNIIYSLDTTNGGGVLQRTISPGSREAITGDNVTVEYFKVILSGTSLSDHWNPRVTVSVGIRPNEPTLRQDVLNLQTTVSARKLDCDLNNPSNC